MSLREAAWVQGLIYPTEPPALGLLELSLLVVLAEDSRLCGVRLDTHLEPHFTPPYKVSR